LDLHGISPVGAHIWYGDDFDPTTKGYLDHDDIPENDGGRGRYAENIKFPLDGSAPGGQYQFWVHVYDQIDTLDPWAVSVYLNRDGSDILQKRYTGIGNSAIFKFDK
jgi:uncharacterized protein YfaP (DUF2135 family)